MDKKIILAIDRDNDVGEKTGIRGPIIGQVANLKAANALVLADPSDTDANAIFAALKLKKEHPSYEIATLTGHKQIGIKSDEVIARQLAIVVKKTKATKAVIVTDGAEDEFIMPILQSKLEITSVQRVVVQQNERLEGAYYMVKNFINNIIDDKRLAKVFLGLPALAFLIIAMFGAEGWRIVIGALGLYLFIKGFKLEKTIGKVTKNLSESLEKGRISFFFYAIGIVFIFISIAFGYYNIRNIGAFDLLTGSLAFIYGSIYVFFIAGLMIWAGSVLFAYSQDKMSARFGTILALFFSIIIVARAATEVLLQPELGINPLVSTIIIGFVALSAALLIEHLSSPPKVK
ncbi:hypothetical protein CL614_06445 [archaeon]|nr:hypothetical protein [archaeon]|tara:strand:+ start:2880 stop:3917 length:1038 start_codon:yes stop_codon:yes gene_type:complete